MVLLWLLLVFPVCINAQITLYRNIGSPSLISNSNIPYTISQSGRYIVTENIIYNATTTTPAITISASNVELDLLNFSIAQTGGVAGVSAISINSGLSGINIGNGGISDFSQSAITVASGCTEPEFDNLAIKDCGNRGIEFNGTGGSPILRCEVTNCSFQTTCTLTTADNVILLNNVNDGIVSGNNFFSNGSTAITGTCSIVKIQNSLRCHITNITINDSNGNFDLRGIEINNSTECIASHVRINTMQASGGGSVCHGVHINNSSVDNFVAESLVEKLTGTSIVDGFLSDTGCNDNIFVNCTAFQNKALDVSGAVHGFRAVNNARNEFKGCIARRNSANNANIAAPLYGAYGFKLDNANQVFVHQCIANNQNATRSVGFFLIATNNCFLTENIANRNVFGFDASNTTFNNQAFIKNFASKNSGGAAQYVGFGANAANDSFTASNFAANTGGVAGVPGPIAWTNLGIQ